MGDPGIHVQLTYNVKLMLGLEYMNEIQSIISIKNNDYILRLGAMKSPVGTSFIDFSCCHAPWNVAF